MQIKLHGQEYQSKEGEGETCDVPSSALVNALWHRNDSVQSNSFTSCKCVRVLCGLLVCITLVNVMFLMKLHSVSW